MKNQEELLSFLSQSGFSLEYLQKSIFYAELKVTPNEQDIDLLLLVLNINTQNLNNFNAEDLDHYIAVLNWLKKYKANSNNSNLEKVRGYLESFHHLCDVQDWERASQIFGSSFDDSYERRDLSHQLLIWGYYQAYIDLCKRYLNIPSMATFALEAIGVAFNQLGKYSEAIEYLQNCLDSTNEFNVLEKKFRGSVLFNLGNIYQNLGDDLQAIQYYEQALSIAKSTDYHALECACHNTLGISHHNLSNYSEAISCSQKSLAIAREYNNRDKEACALLRLGITYRRMEDYHQSIKYCQQSLTIACEIGFRRGEGEALGHIGCAYLCLGELSKAFEFCQQDLDIAREIGNSQGEMRSLRNLSKIHLMLGDHKQALEYAYKDLSIAHESGVTSEKLAALEILITTYKLLKDHSQVVYFYEQLLIIAQSNDDSEFVKETLLELIQYCYNKQQYLQASEYSQQLLVIFHELKAYSLKDGDSSMLVGNLLLHFENHNLAEEYYQLALTIAGETDNRRVEAEAKGNLGSIAIINGNYEQAILYNQETIEIARQTDNFSSEAIALSTLGNCYIFLKKYEEALNYHNKALDIFHRIGDELGAGKTLASIAATQLELERYPEALETSLKALDISRKFKDSRMEVRILLNMTFIYPMLDRLKEAHECNEQSLQLAYSLKIPSIITACENMKGLIENIETQYKHSQQIGL
jgi:tetratricopeptide (TPR) repeat protein